MVIEQFLLLKPAYQEVIADICKQMGAGMAEFAEKGNPATCDEYNLYCHYVAGLVGIGLSRLFAASELESKTVGRELERANSMGLFLQKTNIIRDYLEDLEDGRTWYPKEVRCLFAVCSWVRCCGVYSLVCSVRISTKSKTRIFAQ